MFILHYHHMFNLHWQLVLRISGNMLHKKTRPDAKFSIVLEEGWFGQPKYSTRSKKPFYVMSVSAFIFCITLYPPLVIQVSHSGLFVPHQIGKIIAANVPKYWLDILHVT